MLQCVPVLGRPLFGPENDPIFGTTNVKKI
jgi:hypothetical protein